LAAPVSGLGRFLAGLPNVRAQFPSWDRAIACVMQNNGSAFAALFFLYGSPNLDSGKPRIDYKTRHCAVWHLVSFGFRVHAKIVSTVVTMSMGKNYLFSFVSCFVII
jgi:hypothetical protein